MRKTYILDTSVLIDDPCTYKYFEHSNVIIPVVVLEELDKLKKQSNEAGKNARVAIKLLDQLSDLGDISTGILIENDILVKIDATFYDLNHTFFSGLGDPNYGDTRILACLLSAWSTHDTHDVVLVSNDINLRIKAKAKGIEAEGHKFKASLNDLYSGVQTIVNEEAGYQLQQNSIIDPSAFNIELHPNECILFQNEEKNGIALGKKVANDKIKLIRKFSPWGVSSRNKEQAFAMDLIMDKNIDLVTLIGLAGSGKSLIAIACALELVLNRREYERLIIYRPIQPVSNDIGFIPGTQEEKLAPWFQAIMDSFEFLFSAKGKRDWKKDLEMFQGKGQIEMEAITYIRGRSIPNSIILLDEAQNLNKEDIKTILTRAGDNTKLILTGDVSQIDNSDLDATNNGLSYVIEKFKESPLAGHVTLTQGERSRLATEAAKIL